MQQVVAVSQADEVRDAERPLLERGLGRQPEHTLGVEQRAGVVVGGVQATLRDEAAEVVEAEEGQHQGRLRDRRQQGRADAPPRGRHRAQRDVEHGAYITCVSYCRPMGA
ncbi:hypothetical protein [Nocardioides sp. CCNWLW216]|uniref:hypothetical protein n=1 Tax=Nocardioides sp. CCNWLW216 TaxID=3125803 RepID=UPI00301471A3